MLGQVPFPRSFLKSTLHRLVTQFERDCCQEIACVHHIAICVYVSSGLDIDPRDVRNVQKHVPPAVEFSQSCHVPPVCARLMHRTPECQQKHGFG